MDVKILKRKLSNYTYWGAAGLVVLMLSGCSKPDIPWQVDKETQRWYSKHQVNEGQKVFTSNCASCHGKRAQGAMFWQQPDTDGKYPPPPLNGSAHAWHHPYSMLLNTVTHGTKGNMPAWKDELTEAQIESTIAYFQHFWPDRTYEAWLERNKR